MKKYFIMAIAVSIGINAAYSQFPEYHLMKDASAVLTPRSADYHKRLDLESVQLFRKPFVNIRYVKYKDSRDSETPVSVLPVETIDNPDGTVTAKWEDGSVYRGQMYYGEIRGVGTMIYPDGSSYSGEWSSDRPNGNGTFVTPEGVACEVGWTDGIPHGRGIIQDTDGKLYSAKWRDGVIKPKSVRPVED